MTQETNLSSRTQQLGYAFANDNTVRIWDTKTGECRQTLQGNKDSVYCLSGKKPLTRLDDKTVRIWDAKTGKCKPTPKGHTSMFNCLQMTDEIPFTASKDAFEIFLGRNHETPSPSYAEENSINSILPAEITAYVLALLNPDPGKLSQDGYSARATCTLWYDLTMSSNAAYAATITAKKKKLEGYGLEIIWRSIYCLNSILINQFKDTQNFPELHDSADKIRAWLTDPRNQLFTDQVTELHLLMRFSRLELPEEIGLFKSLVKLDLSLSNIKYFPEKICGLKSLTELNLASNNLTNIPNKFSELKLLKNLNISHNNFTSFPVVISQLPSLEKLVIGASDSFQKTVISFPCPIEEITAKFNHMISSKRRIAVENNNVENNNVNSAVFSSLLYDLLTTPLNDDNGDINSQMHRFSRMPERMPKYRPEPLPIMYPELTPELLPMNNAISYKALRYLSKKI